MINLDIFRNYPGMGIIYDWSFEEYYEQVIYIMIYNEENQRWI